ncbi:hypothetical protein L6452_02180 [Arctium lappa]|uniref:Uncharacterized protein n=1 Tax=Arctium lappa TaxID=4217 RepID=A0ACB9FJC6_ARCLA|nr:hypothetical protein L6452_02180 [Arctium lappa]
MADKTSDKSARTLASKRTMEAIPDPTTVPFTSAIPSLGCSSKKPLETPARVKAFSALRVSPLWPTALELGRPLRSPAIYAILSPSKVDVSSITITITITIIVVW